MPSGIIDWIRYVIGSRKGVEDLHDLPNRAAWVSAMKRRGQVAGDKWRNESDLKQFLEDYEACLSGKAERETGKPFVDEDLCGAILVIREIHRLDDGGGAFASLRERCEALIDAYEGRGATNRDIVEAAFALAGKSPPGESSSLNETVSPPQTQEPPVENDDATLEAMHLAHQLGELSVRGDSRANDHEIRRVVETSVEATLLSAYAVLDSGGSGSARNTANAAIGRDKWRENIDNARREGRELALLQHLLSPPRSLSDAEASREGWEAASTIVTAAEETARLYERRAPLAERHRRTQELLKQIAAFRKGPNAALARLKGRPLNEWPGAKIGVAETATIAAARLERLHDRFAEMEAVLAETPPCRSKVRLLWDKLRKSPGDMREVQEEDRMGKLQRIREIDEEYKLPVSMQKLGCDCRSITSGCKRQAPR